MVIIKKVTIASLIVSMACAKSPEMTLMSDFSSHLP